MLRQAPANTLEKSGNRRLRKGTRDMKSQMVTLELKNTIKWNLKIITE